MKCEVCEVPTRITWKGGNLFHCDGCNTDFIDLEQGAKYQGNARLKFEREEQTRLNCPYCEQYCGGLKDDLSNLDCVVKYDGKTRVAHKDCLELDQRNTRNQEIIFNKQISLIEKVAEILCPHCGKLGIYLESESSHPAYGFLRPYWECSNCDTRIDKHWLMSQIRKA